MNPKEFELNGEFILLTSLLKLIGIAATGGHAGLMVSEGEVIVNEEIESRKRRKCRVGDQIEVNGQIINIV